MEKCDSGETYFGNEDSEKRSLKVWKAPNGADAEPNVWGRNVQGKEAY